MSRLNLGTFWVLQTSMTSVDIGEHSTQDFSRKTGVEILDLGADGEPWRADGDQKFFGGAGELRKNADSNHV